MEVVSEIDPAIPALGGRSLARAARDRADEALAGVPRWTRRFGILAVLFTIAALASVGLLLAELVEGSMVRSIAIFLATMALGSGVAAVVARLVHTALAGRLDLLSQALEASPNAQLIVAPDGSLAYANAAFHRFFPSLHGSP